MKIKNNLRVRDVVYGILILSAFVYTQWLTSSYSETVDKLIAREDKHKDLIITQAQESFLEGCQNFAKKACGSNKELCAEVLESCRMESAVYQFKVIEHYK